jgi:hypothetical protein
MLRSSWISYRFSPAPLCTFFAFFAFFAFFTSYQQPPFGPREDKNAA